MAGLRLLNFDDLLILRHLLAGATITATAAEMGLTQPAVTQRLRKMEGVFGGPILRKVGRRSRLTEAGVALGEKARAALSLMQDVGTEPAPQALTVGTRSEVGLSWLFPALVRLRRLHPTQCFHCHFGSGEEILRMLVAGELDAILTSAPHAVRGFGAVDVAREAYVIVAAHDIARAVRSIDDLRGHVLIEHDRSFPFLRYVDPAVRATITCRDVWFVGSTSAMTSALVHGFGFGIVPRYLVRTPLSTGTLRRILPRVKLAADRFRIVYRLDRDLERPVTLLCDALARSGLRA